jgi:propionate CoA-transferase
VEHRTFSGAEALKRGQRVLYVTERCVFQLVAGAEGASELELIELAPGIDLQRDVLEHMSFEPRISADLRPMDARLFDEETMGLREQLLDRPLDERLALDGARKRLHIDFSGLQVNSGAVIADIEAAIRQRLEPYGHRVDVVVNYDHFGIVPELLDEYSAMVKRLAAAFYGRVTRYGTTGFLKSRL